MQKAIIGKKVGMTQIFDETRQGDPRHRHRGRPLRRRAEENCGQTTAMTPFSWVFRISPRSKLSKPEAGHFEESRRQHEEIPERVPAGRYFCL